VKGAGDHISCYKGAIISYWRETGAGLFDFPVGSLEAMISYL
jgi:hypothetical protein